MLRRRPQSDRSASSRTLHDDDCTVIMARNKPQVLTLDNIVGSMKVKKLFDYVEDQVHPKISGARALSSCTISEKLLVVKA